MFIIIYRLHNKLNAETKYVGPFEHWDDAYDHLCTLPAIGGRTEPGNAGCKYIEELEKIK